MTIEFNCPYCGKNLKAEEDRNGKSGPCAECGAPISIPDPNNRFAGAAQSDRFQFKPGLWGLLFGLGMLMLLVMLVFIASLRSTGGPSHQSWCMNNLREIMQAVQIHEVRIGTYPLASTQPFTGQPGTYQSPHPAGYSWQVSIMQYLGMKDVYDQWKLDSQDFQLSPFDPANNLEIPALSNPIFTCPTSPTTHVELNQSEYSLLNTGSGQIAPARSSYVGFAASHFTNAKGPGQLYGTDPDFPFDGNGVFVFPKTAGETRKGISSADVTDGLSNTLALCESLETSYAAWCDGQAMWTVGAWPGSAKMPTVTGGPEGLLGWPDTDKQSRASIGSGSDDDPAEMYLPASRYHAQYDRRWGPSSRHGNEAVMHMFSDGHLQMIHPNIDRNLYLRLISRDGSEQSESINWDKSGI